MALEDRAEELQNILYNQGQLDVESITTPATGSAAVAISTPDAHSVTVLTLSGATPVLTLGAPKNIGQRKTVYLIQDAVGSRIPTWAVASGSLTWLAGAAPTLQTVAGSIDKVNFESVDGTNWLGTGSSQPGTAGVFTTFAASGNATVAGTLGVTGATSVHNFGMGGKAAVGMATTYTQTYSTAARVIPAATATAVTATSSQNGTTAAVDLPTSEALANALKISYNAAQVDIAALCVSNTALIADVLALKKLIVALVQDITAVGIAT